MWKTDYDKALNKLAKASRKLIVNYNKDKDLWNAYEEYDGLIRPVDASKTYDTYISLLSNSTSDNVELSIQDANAIINDEWDWAIAAKTTNAFYSSR